MDSIFTKLILFFASILTVLSGPNYIRLGADSLTFDFKTGENYPIYYFLNVQNIGPEKERFETSSDQPWISVYREGTDFSFVELPSQAYINFVLEIHPERLADGVNKVEIKLRVLDIDSLASQEVVLDEAEVSITLSKNIIITPGIQPETTQPEVIQPTSLVVTPTLTASPGPVSTSPPMSIPTKTPTILSPAPSLSPSPEVVQSSDLNLILNRIQSLIDSIRSFLKGLF